MLTRRSFLRLLGVGGAAAAVAPAVLVPERKIWQVPANAPVPTRGWQADWAEIFKRAYAPFVDPNLGGYDDVVLINARRFGKTYALRERMRELEAQGRPTLYVSPQTYAGLEADLRAMKPDLTFSVPRREAPELAKDLPNPEAMLVGVNQAFRELRQRTPAWPADDRYEGDGLAPAFHGDLRAIGGGPC